MTEIDVCEFNSREAAKFSYEGVSNARARAHALLLILLSGGGGLGGLALAQWQQSKAVSLCAAVAAAWWFFLALRVATKAMASDEVRSWAVGGLAECIPEWATYVKDVQAEGGSAVLVDEVRLSALRSADKAAAEYREVSTRVFVALDRIYLQMAATPLVCVLAAGVAWGFRL